MRGEHNSLPDGKRGVRFARVPTGAETCPFCLMLAGRGAVYHTRKTAGEFRHFHRRCDCKVVPGFEDDPDAEIVKGFSPAGLRDRIGRIEQATGLQFESSKDSAALREYLQQLDAAWMTTGATCSVTRERGAHPLKKEEAAAGFLAGNGWNVEFMREVNKTGVKTADARLNGSVWEFKIPEGWSDADGESLQGEHTVRKQFYKALGKGTDKLLLSNAENSASFDEMGKVARRVLKTGDYEINEVLVVDPIARRIAYIDDMREPLGEPPLLVPSRMDIAGWGCHNGLVVSALAVPDTARTGGGLPCPMLPLSASTCTRAPSRRRPSTCTRGRSSSGGSAPRRAR